MLKTPHFLIILLGFVIYALEVINIYCVCKMEILVLLIPSQLCVQ